MQLALIPRTVGNTYRNFLQHNGSTYAAGLAFFFLMSLFPFLIFLASAMAYMPIPRLFERTLRLMSLVAPADAMTLVHNVVRATLHKNKGLLSVGIVGAVWAASSGFRAMITALNTAYGAIESRPFWKTRLLAIGLTFLVGWMVIIALVAMVLGPRFGLWITSKLGLRATFALVWPLIRWAIILAFTTISVEVLYFLGPNIKQRFKAQIPGAVVAVVLWLVSSSVLGWYLRSFTHFNKTYGALGAVIALMLWFHVSALVILVGAELNAELLKSGGK